MVEQTPQTEYRARHQLAGHARNQVQSCRAAIGTMRWKHLSPPFPSVQLICYPVSMPISVFENSSKEDIYFILYPNGARYELPPLARVGVRYSFEEGEVDRTFSYIERNSISFWCYSQNRQVEIIRPNAFDRLLWDICHGYGYCSGAQVTDLLPATGMVTAEEFAELVLRAEGEAGEHTPPNPRSVASLGAMFIKYMESASVPVERLVQTLAQPFDAECL